MQEIVIKVLNTYGYWGLFLLIILENIFPPIPSEVILLFVGFMIRYSNLSFLATIVVSTLASLLGAIMLYYIGYYINDERIIKFTKSKIGKILHLKRSNIGDANKNFAKKGRKSVFFFRFVPIMRSLISIPAGHYKMPMNEFLFLTVLGSLIWNTTLIKLGDIFGEKWPIIAVIFAKYSKIVKVIIVLILLIYIYKKMKRNRKQLKKVL